MTLIVDQDQVQVLLHLLQKNNAQFATVVFLKMNQLHAVHVYLVALLVIVSLIAVYVKIITTHILILTLLQLNAVNVFVLIVCM